MLFISPFFHKILYLTILFSFIYSFIHSCERTLFQKKFCYIILFFFSCCFLGSGSSSRDFPNGVFSLCACPVSLELTHYTSAGGLHTDSEITKIDEKWGKNHLAVHTPSFLELLQVQLLSPLAMFQVFCALLWLLDEYWSYTAWSLVSVVIFETTTVFQRTRTQKMLGT